MSLCSSGFRVISHFAVLVLGALLSVVSVQAWSLPSASAANSANLAISSSKAVLAVENPRVIIEDYAGKMPILTSDDLSISTGSDISLSIGSNVTLVGKGEAPLPNHSSNPQIIVKEDSPHPLTNHFHLDGDLYIDYSILGTNGQIITENPAVIWEFSSTEIQIGDAERVLPGDTNAPTNYMTRWLSATDNITFEETGNWLLFSPQQLLGGSFKANNIYVGNFSAFAAVPVPSTALLILFFLLIPMVCRPKQIKQVKQI